MILNTIQIFNFRNIESMKIALHPEQNIIYGDNGAGKTSILEAISCIFLGKSFRTSQTKNLVSSAHDRFTISATIMQNERHPNPMRIGMEKQTDNTEQLKLNGDKTYRSKAASLLPILTITPQSHAILEAGPAERRQFINWGLFHVKQDFLSVWQENKKILQHRNALLRSGQTSLLPYWDQKFEEAATKLYQLHAQYVEEINPALQKILEQLAPNLSIELQYHAGWPQHKTLAESLKDNIVRDLKYGYTSSGPHRADLIIKHQNNNAAAVLSRGQQKALVTALRIAQGQLLKQATEKNALYLLDDLPSELDINYRENVLNFLCELKVQTIITTINPDDLAFNHSNKNQNLFHIQNGAIID
ncbi:MAG: DNA replication/repair protein RecF [Gammaproteobacteria bacterium]|nr:DNA replication/repair protein RecF [Gammaproteobacteria bacterium]